MEKVANRLPSETIPIRLELGESFHELEISLAYDPKSYILREVIFVGRGKIGQGLDLMLHELGIKLSRAIQGRDPETGEKIDG